MPAELPLDLIESDNVELDNEALNIPNSDYVMSDEVIKAVDEKFKPNGDVEILDEF